ncbi:MAG: type III pantothenate kinase [Oscillospiraceae bacterium]|nr:type III pantothenate kinase [Oscillospiraceae bacterium]
MVMTVSIKNQSVRFGFYRNHACVATFDLASDIARTADEYAVLLAGGMSLQSLDPRACEGAIIASVQPPLTERVASAINRVCGVIPCEVGPGLKTGLNIKIENPAQLGSDLVAMSVGALAQYKAPLLLVDFEVATTVSAIDENGAFCGVVIAPGVTESLSSLSKHAAKLPEISLSAPKCVIGKNTVEAMRSGAVYGAASMVDGLVERMSAELKAPVTVLASGKHCGLILEKCKTDIREDQMLVLDGLYEIYRKNLKGGRKK